MGQRGSSGIRARHSIGASCRMRLSAPAGPASPRASRSPPRAPRLPASAAPVDPRARPGVPVEIRMPSAPEASMPAKRARSERAMLRCVSAGSAGIPSRVAIGVSSRSSSSASATTASASASMFRRDRGGSAPAGRHPPERRDPGEDRSRWVSRHVRHPRERPDLREADRGGSAPADRHPETSRSRGHRGGSAPAGPASAKLDLHLAERTSSSKLDRTTRAPRRSAAAAVARRIRENRRSTPGTRPTAARTRFGRRTTRSPILYESN